LNQTAAARGQQPLAGFRDQDCALQVIANSIDRSGPLLASVNPVVAHNQRCERDDDENGQHHSAHDALLFLCSGSPTFLSVDSEAMAAVSSGVDSMAPTGPCVGRPPMHELTESSPPVARLAGLHAE
jgi:hypothetical protein